MRATAKRLWSSAVSLPENTTLKTFHVISKMPTTQLRIAFTIVLMMGTGIRYWASHTWKPETNWLTFLAIAMGIDTVSHIGQRVTDIDYTKAKKNPAPVDDEPGTPPPKVK